MDKSKEFCYMCYDSHSNCFWATTSIFNGVLYQLNRYLYEIDCISIDIYEIYHQDILEVSYNAFEDAILLFFRNYTLEIHKIPTINCIPSQLRYNYILHDYSTNCCNNIYPCNIDGGLF